MTVRLLPLPMGRYLTVKVGSPDESDSSSHVASYADSMKSSISFSSSLLYTCAARGSKPGTQQSAALDPKACVMRSNQARRTSVHTTKGVSAAVGVQLCMSAGVGRRVAKAYLCWEGLALLEAGGALAPSAIFKPCTAPTEHRSKLGICSLKMRSPHFVIADALLERLGACSHCRRVGPPLYLSAEGSDIDPKECR